MEMTEIPAEASRRLQELGTADIVVGIPSFNSADTIGHVVRTVQQGLHQYFPVARGIIVNSDGGSNDGTAEQVMDESWPDGPVTQVSPRAHPVEKLSTPYFGIPGKGSALRLVLEIARSLGAKACAVVDSDVRSIRPEWVQLLVRPVLEQGFDFVAPYYLRHKFDGTITNSVVYPLTRALYGRRIRQPLGGEFCFSAPLIEHYLRQDVWNTDVARFGIDVWLTTQALCGGFRPCQVFLGAKIHNPKDPASDLSSMLAQVLGATFAEMARNAMVWQKVRTSEPVATFGEVGLVETEPVRVNVRQMIDSYRMGYENLAGIWRLVLPPATLLELQRLARRPDSDFVFPDEVWVRLVYDFAIAHHLRLMNRDHLLRGLTPLYLGRVASFVLEMESADAVAVENGIEELCVRYEKEKPYLISRWRSPDRFRP